MENYIPIYYTLSIVWASSLQGDLRRCTLKVYVVEAEQISDNLHVWLFYVYYNFVQFSYFEWCFDKIFGFGIAFKVPILS